MGSGEKLPGNHNYPISCQPLVPIKTEISLRNEQKIKFADPPKGLLQISTILTRRRNSKNHLFLHNHDLRLLNFTKKR